MREVVHPRVGVLRSAKSVSELLQAQIAGVLTLPPKAGVRAIAVQSKEDTVGMHYLLAVATAMRRVPARARAARALGMALEGKVDF